MTRTSSDRGRRWFDRLTNLVSIFQKPELDFSQNRADQDDLLGDAYEYLMRHFATQSGKSKGQFYTPAEVSRVIAKVIGISPSNTIGSTTAYDPTCGSGSLLLKVAAEAGTRITLEGQEKDVTTAGLARMNMILHEFPTARILAGNTLASPQFLDGAHLRTYDYVVANPPFSDKSWSTGLTPSADPYQRFGWGEPPPKQGDYAYLLHIIRSLKGTGKGACILPHGVLFRWNAEGVIRRQLVISRYLKGIIGLPPNLFYGTGIPACILVLDKEGAASRTGIFMIDAAKGFAKDGAKNRLREQDIHRIVDTFARLEDVPGYARLVPFAEIADPKNDHNLNLPRYVDTSEPEDVQDIGGHLHGGIPERDLDALRPYWDVMPGLQATLFASYDRPGYVQLRVPVGDLRTTILGHPEFEDFQAKASSHFEEWRTATAARLRAFDTSAHPKALVAEIAETLLAAFRDVPLVNAYDVYQHLMAYWADAMEDDAYLIAADGWAAVPTRVIEIDKKGKSKDKGWACDLLPKPLVVARYFANHQTVIDAVQASLDEATAALAELEEEHGAEDGYLGALDKIAKAEVNARLRDIRRDRDAHDEITVLNQWIELTDKEAGLKRDLRDKEATLDTLAHRQYAKLTETDIKGLVIDDKWMAHVSGTVTGELERVSQTLTRRVRELADRYDAPLSSLIDDVATLTARVEGHLARMGA